MNSTLKQLQDIRSDICVSIILNTHRTRPDNTVDSITLKNLCKRAEERLNSFEGNREIGSIVQRLHELASSIDHNHNLESLALFVNEDIAEYTRLTVSVTDRVVINNTFSTRDLIKAQHQETHFLVLVLSQQRARLIEALNDAVVKEYGDRFPMENMQPFATNKAEKSNANRQTHLIAEFFNKIDKEVNKVRNRKALPVLICSEIGNYHEYLKIADQKDSILEVFLNSNRLDEEPQQIVKEAWTIVQEQTIHRIHTRKQELLEAVNQGNYVSDINDIYRAILEGKVQTLFIEEGLFQPGKIENQETSYISDEEWNQNGVRDDVYDELIKSNHHFGGETIFLPKDQLSDFNGLGAVTRY